MMRSVKGFTLIELLVVIAIIGLLSTIAVASLQHARAKARDTVRIANLTQITKALEVYYDEHGAYPIAGTCGPRAGVYQSNATFLLTDFGWAGCDTTNWEDFGAELGIANLSDDPLHNSVLYPGFAYYPFGNFGDYGNVYSAQPDGQKYDLFTRLETSHELTCENTLSNFKSTNPDFAGGSWAEGNPVCGGFPLGALGNQIYAAPH